MAEHDKCPRCGGRSVTETFNPPRKGTDFNVPGDVRESRCTTQHCGWRSKATYKKGEGWVWEVPTFNADRKKGLTRR